VTDGFRAVAIETTQVHGVIPGVVLGPLTRCAEHFRTGRYSGPVNRIHGVTVGGAEGKMQLPGLRPAALIGASQNASRRGKLMRKHHALARRLLDRQDDYLRFTRDFRVPPDNNGTERDIRMAKLKQKVSGCLRTMTGARQFCTIRSYLSTAAKHGLSSFDALVMLAEGQPWMPAAA
jgi:transposase